MLNQSRPRNNSDLSDLILRFADYIAPSPAEPAPPAIHSVQTGGVAMQSPRRQFAPAAVNIKKPPHSCITSTPSAIAWSRPAAYASTLPPAARKRSFHLPTHMRPLSTGRVRAISINLRAADAGVEKGRSAANFWKAPCHLGRDSDDGRQSSRAVMCPIWALVASKSRGSNVSPHGQ
jgi:hypothetical protein